jgi:metal-dependent amidase/aminoacylase/carboxypeptidase family protein
MSFGEQLIAWRRELHQNPELSGQEVETTARLRQWLTNAGIARSLTTCRPGWWRKSARATS